MWVGSAGLNFQRHRQVDGMAVRRPLAKAESHPGSRSVCLGDSFIYELAVERGKLTAT